jgi:ABC-type sugar transport system ATPase subunit
MSAAVTALTKRYGSTLALDGVTIEIADGEIHALLGHNGAGKSTLIKCLGGGIAPTSGEITIGGESFDSLTPRSSQHAGVAVIYQHLSLIDRLSVAENLFLGHESTRGGVIRRSAQREIARSALARVGAAAIDPDVAVGTLAIGQRQLVEIAKALQREARLLILDEPTAALSKAEADGLGMLLETLKSEGIAILYVTHLLGEVLKLADRATVLRDGRAVWAADRAGITRESLVAAISDGHGAQTSASTPPRSGQTPALELRSLTAAGLSPIDLTIAPGEIVACYGLIGSGRTRLLNTVFGRIPATGGEVIVDGVVKNPSSPSRAIRAGIALVPGDRAREGLFASLSASGNVVIDAMRRLARWGVRSIREERRVFNATAEWLNLLPRDAALPAGRFSGGNQQKILLSRWVNDTARTRVLLLDDPTQGVDVGARRDIYDAIKALAADRGIGVLVNSNEPEEVIDLAHRCLLMRQGAVIDEIDVSRTTADALLTAVHSASVPSVAPDHRGELA